MFNSHYCYNKLILLILSKQNLGLKRTACPSNQYAESISLSQASKMREVKKVEFRNPGGGGGGATAIFTVNIISSIKKEMIIAI